MSDVPSVVADSEAPDPGFWGRERPHRGRATPSRPRARGPVDRVLDRIRDWRGDPRLAVGALVLVAVVAGVVWYRLGAASGAGPDTGARHRYGASSPTTRAPSANGGKVTVHVAGAVTKPGVYQLSTSARVIDAVEAAGGGMPGADLDRLNLAAKLADGQRVLVQKVGDSPAGAAGGSAAGGQTTAAGGIGEAAEGGQVNLNTATQGQLEALPGVGPSLARAIIAERERHGGFRSVNELRNVRGIGEKRFADLKDKVTV